MACIFTTKSGGIWEIGAEHTQAITPTHSHAAQSSNGRSGEIQTPTDSTRPAERHLHCGPAGGTGLPFLSGGAGCFSHDRSRKVSPMYLTTTNFHQLQTARN